MITVYYDADGPGINATCESWPCRNEHFSSMDELKIHLNMDYSGNYQLIEITNDNYSELCALGIFNESL